MFSNFSTLRIDLGILLSGAFLISSPALANEIPAGDRKGSVIGVEVINIDRQDGNLVTALQFDFSQVNLSSNTEVVVTPKYISGNDSILLEPLTVAGRNRWYWLQRNGQAQGLLVKGFGKDKGQMTESNAGTLSTHYSASLQNSRLSTYNLSLSTPYREWMETADFVIDTEVRGCANCIKKSDDQTPDIPLAQTDFIQRSFFPEFLYVAPVAEAVKMREISARAYIDFPVNRTEIYPDYRRNPEELAKIRATIDSVRNDRDIKITSLHISGTASPEGGYQNNVRLASGRTESLKNYVQGLYHFAPGFITTSFEPVDWKGLAEFLRTVLYSGSRSLTPGQQTAVRLDSIRFDQFGNIPGNIEIWREKLPDAAAILGIVDSNIEPFERNNKIKFTYKDQYAWLLENVYPALRHSDYRIQFEIKTYTDVAEILEVMADRPQNLSLAELFVAANSQPVGSELYDRAFDLAVTMYPDDETANLNAGINAMRRGDLVSADKYLPKAGESPEAEYARALLILLQGDEETALNMLQSLSGSLNQGVANAASTAVNGLQETKASNARTFIRY